MLRAGDTVRALPGTTAEMWAEGTLGIVAEVRDPYPHSHNDSQNLVRWNGGRDILMGFRPNEVEKVDANIEPRS